MKVNGKYGRREWMGDTDAQADRPHIGVAWDWEYKIDLKRNNKIVIGRFGNSWKRRASALILEEFVQENGHIEIVTRVNRFTLRSEDYHCFIPIRTRYQRAGYVKQEDGTEVFVWKRGKMKSKKTIVAFNQEGRVLSQFPVPVRKDMRRAQVRRAKKQMVLQGAISFQKVTEEKWMELMFPSLKEE